MDTSGSLISICKPNSILRVERITCRSRDHGISQNFIPVAHDNATNIQKLLMKSLSNMLQWFVEVSICALWGLLLCVCVCLRACVCVHPTVPPQNRSDLSEETENQFHQRETEEELK